MNALLMPLSELHRRSSPPMQSINEVIRMQSQFDHIAETYFSGFDFDLGERELGYALSFDYDLEMFSASAGLIKTAVSSIFKEEGKTSIALVDGLDH